MSSNLQYACKLNQKIGIKLCKLSFIYKNLQGLFKYHKNKILPIQKANMLKTFEIVNPRTLLCANITPYTVVWHNNAHPIISK